MNRLLYEHEGKKVEVPLADKPVSLGRSDEADHKLPTKTASRLHAQVMPRDGGWWIEDLHSSNGTIVNGKKIEGATELSPGDTIVLGDFKLTFDGPPKRPPDHLIARLLYHAEPGKPPVEILIRDRVTIGRKKDNTLRIDSKTISGHHCEVISRDGTYMLRDLGSSNGTFVDKEPVTEHTLRNGETLLLGKTVTLYFVDPAVPAMPAGSPPPEPDAFNRGTFEPVRVAPPKPPVRNPVPAIAVGLVLGALFVVAGWLMGDLIKDLRAPKTASKENKPIAPLDDPVFSFEGEIDDKGNPDGWTASFEAGGGATAELLSDPDAPYDGNRSLSIGTRNVEGTEAPVTGMVILSTQEQRRVDVGAACKVRIHARGKDAQRVGLALSVVDDKGRALTVATGSFVALRSDAWVPLEMIGQVMTPLPAGGQYRLLICGTFSRLWIDRLEIEKLPGEPVTPLARASGPELNITVDKDPPYRTAISNATHRTRFAPRLLSAANASLSEPDLWSVESAGVQAVTYSAMLARDGSAAKVELKAAARLADYFASTGIELQWTWSSKPAVHDSLAVEIEMPLPPDATILLADRQGTPLDVNRDALHTYAYSTVSELAVSETDFAVSFPDGAVVWFDLSRQDRLTAVVRAASESRQSLRLIVFTRPLMFARLYERVFDEAARMWEARHGSAAKARLAYLVSENRPHNDLRVITSAREKLNELEAERLEMLSKLQALWKAADENRTPQTVMAAEQAVRAYLSTWPGEGDVSEVEDRLKMIATWNEEIANRARTPEEQVQAESIARRLWKDAEEARAKGRTLVTLMLLENLLSFYKGTSVYPGAEVLSDEVNKELGDPAKQDAIIDTELAVIDEDLQYRDFGLAKKRCLKLLERFPHSPRNREIMQRLHKAEAG